jgi:hypothetical protein
MYIHGGMDGMNGKYATVMYLASEMAEIPGSVIDIIGLETWLCEDAGCNSSTPVEYYLGGTDFNGTVSSSAVPLPAAAWLFGSALLGFGALKRRKA